MKIGFNRTSVVSEVSVTSPLRAARNVLPEPVESMTVMPSKDAQMLRHRLAMAELVTAATSIPETAPISIEKRASVAKRVLMTLGAISVISAGPALFSILAIGPLGIAVAAGMAILGMTLIRMCKEMD
jgi:hypothetical protein